MEFEKIEKFVQKEYGINLSAYKSKQLIRRIENFMQRAGAKNEIDFITKLSSDSNLSKKFLDHLTINVSEFFRNKELFLDLEQKIKYYLRPEKNSLKIWSAACSIGAEPYTLAIIMDRLTPNKKHTIIATDIDQTILEVAKQGVYNKNEIRNVDDNTLNKYFTKKDDKFYISEDIKKKGNI